MTGGWFMALFYPHFLVFTIKNCYFLVFSFHQHSHHCHHWGAPHPVIFASRCVALLRPRSSFGAAGPWSGAWEAIRRPARPWTGRRGIPGDPSGNSVASHLGRGFIHGFMGKSWENHWKIFNIFIFIIFYPLVMTNIAMVKPWP